MISNVNICDIPNLYTLKLFLLYTKKFLIWKT